MLSLERHPKDGGVFVEFCYDDTQDTGGALQDILDGLKQAAIKHGGVPSWTGLPRGDFWLIKGKPWKEVCYAHVFV